MEVVKIEPKVYKFNEGNFIEELRAYFDGTYDGHYAIIMLYINDTESEDEVK